MKTDARRYKYLKQIDGRGRYGEVEIEINLIDSKSTVMDVCDWRTLKESYPDFKELEILKLWKQSAIDASQCVIDTYQFPESIEIKIIDVVGLYVDTVPAHIGAATIIGIFDLMDKPLKPEDLKSLDEFVTRNSEFELIPNYKEYLEYRLTR